MKPIKNSQRDLVVLIPARNEAHRIPFTLENVQQSYLLPDQKLRVAVCANACTDHTLEVLEEMKLRHKNLDVVLEHVPGKARALNTLLDHAEDKHRMEHRDTVVLLDADTELQPDTLAEVSWLLHSNDDFHAVAANEVSMPPATQSLLDHLLFGLSDLSVSAIAMRDRKSSCTAVRGNKMKGVRFPENVIAEDQWLTLHLNPENVELHPTAFTVKEGSQNFLDFTAKRVRDLMGLYQLEDYFEPEAVREELPLSTREHVHAMLTEAELRQQMAELPGIYQLANLVSVPLHAAFKVAAWVGYRMSPRPRNESHPVSNVNKTPRRTPVQTPRVTPGA